MKPNYDRIIRQCIEIGLLRGWQRAHKHVDSPDQIAIFDAMEESIMDEIYEMFEIGSYVNDI